LQRFIRIIESPLREPIGRSGHARRQLSKSETLQLLSVARSNHLTVTEVVQAAVALCCGKHIACKGQEAENFVWYGQFSVDCRAGLLDKQRTSLSMVNDFICLTLYKQALELYLKGKVSEAIILLANEAKETYSKARTTAYRAQLAERSTELYAKMVDSMKNGSLA
jgi:hypothetical protein